MPPRKAPAAGVSASPAAGGRGVAPSPARSTRSTRSNRGRDDDEWDNESVSSSFKVPVSRTGKSSNPLLGPHDTSVNIAAAFHAAQSGNLPTPSSDRSFKPPSKVSSKARPKPSTPRNVQRERSPAEQLLSSARALSPVRFFLRPGDDGVEDEADHSGEYASFSSLGNRNGHGNGNGNGNGNGANTSGSANTSGEQSYDYAAEESLVRRAQMAQKGSGGGVGGHARRVSDTTARRRKGREGDLPYRPGEEDEVYSDDSGGEGEGIVRGGALDARADTRGKRAEKGEGYLGMGLGLQPRARRKGRRSGDVSYAEGESEEEHENENGMGNLDLRGHSPFAASMVNGNARSPTPASLIRAITPQVDRRSPMPMPQTPSRRRQPPTSRTVVTNLLHGVVTALRFVVDLVSSLLNALVVHPIRTAFGSGKSIVRTAKRDWWKYILGLVVLSLLIRLADRPWRSTGKYTAPDVPPSSMDELISRLTQIEQALSSLSASSNALERADAEGRGERETITSRVGELESSIAQERRHREVTRTEGQKGFQDIRGEVEGLRSEVRSLVSRVTEQEKGVSSARSAAQTLVAVGKEVEALKARVGAVEQDVRDALDDGRMRRALERILPSEMPVRVNKGGSIDVDPAFWTEMKRVLIGRGEVESMVRNVIGSAGGAQGGNGGDREASQGIREEELEAWGERLVAKKTKDGAIISRSDFLRLLDAEVTNLRQVMEDMSRKAPAPAPPSPGKSSTPSTVTIKSSKGDDLTSLLQGLIDAALLRYSKDTIARPDYALFSAGGRVVPSITTDTLVMRRSGAFGRYVLGKKDVEGLPPARALHPDNSVGSCWPFKGDQGQLGVLLSRRAVVGDVTIEHAPSEVAHDVSSAPRNVEVWGLVEGTENKANVAEYLATHPSSESAFPPSPDHLLLANVTYDPSLPNHVQTFPIDPEIVNLGVDVGIVIFRVQSNWGADFTCLYRVRVHGDAV